MWERLWNAIKSGAGNSGNNEPGNESEGEEEEEKEVERVNEEKENHRIHRVHVPMRLTGALAVEEERLNEIPALREDAAARTDALTMWSIGTLGQCARKASHRLGGGPSSRACEDRVEIAEYLRRVMSAARARRTNRLNGRLPYDEEEADGVPRPYPVPRSTEMMAELLGVRYPPVPDLPAYQFAWTDAKAIYAWWRAELINSAMPMAIAADEISGASHRPDRGGPAQGPRGAFQTVFADLAKSYTRGTLAKYLTGLRPATSTPLLMPFASIAAHRLTMATSRRDRVAIVEDLEEEHAAFYTLAAAHGLHLLPADLIRGAVHEEEEEEGGPTEAAPPRTAGTPPARRVWGEAHVGVGGRLLPSGRLALGAEEEEEEEEAGPSTGVLTVIGSPSFLAATAVVSWRAVMPSTREWLDGPAIAGAYLLAGELVSWRRVWYYPESPACALALALASAHMDAVDEQARRLGRSIEIYADRDFGLAERIEGPYEDIVGFLQHGNAEEANGSAMGMDALGQLLQTLVFDHHFASAADANRITPIYRSIYEVMRTVLAAHPDETLEAYMAFVDSVVDAPDRWAYAKGAAVFVPPSVVPWPVDPEFEEPLEALAAAVEILAALQP